MLQNVDFYNKMYAAIKSGGQNYLSDWPLHENVFLVDDVMCMTED